MDDPRQWVRVRNDVLRQIEEGVLEPGDEVWITCEARDHHVTYEAASKALRSLAEEGKLKPPVSSKPYQVI